MTETAPADHPSIQRVQSTIDYFKMHKIKTQIIASDLCGSPSIEPLKGLNCIAIRDSDMEDVMERGVPYNAPPSYSSPCIRARQARYPTSYLQSSKGEDIFQVMTAGTRSLANATLNEGMRQMGTLEKSIRNYIRGELQRGLRVQSLNADGLARLYDFDRKLLHEMIEAKNNKRGSSEEVERIAMRLPGLRCDHLGYRLNMITWGPPLLRYGHGEESRFWMEYTGEELDENTLPDTTSTFDSQHSSVNPTGKKYGSPASGREAPIHLLNESGPQDSSQSSKVERATSIGRHTRGNPEDDVF